MECKDMQALAE
jgi:hypothetical protein